MRKAAVFVFIVSALVVLFAARPAAAAFHNMKIVEVFPGTPAAPGAQYVVLQMWSSGQNFVSGHSIRVYDAGGGVLGTFTFSGDVANGANQARILIATPQAVSFFGVNADLAMTAAIPLAGGRVCFSDPTDSFVVDCVAWGSFSGAGGPPFLTGQPFNPGGGLPAGQALRRRLDLAGQATVLDPGDDTNNSIADFVLGAPAPINNSGQMGTVPPSTCGNGAVEGLEPCDDGNASNTDACLVGCVAASCGDGFVRAGVEACDDGNTSNTDACLNTCAVATCGDGFVRAGVEPCDDGNASNTDACLVGCVAATCGDGFVHAGVEACDDGNVSNTDACLTTCEAARCGDGFTRAGVEACDDGNMSNTDACTNVCAVARCGDGFVRAGVEACDDGKIGRAHV